MCMKMDYKIYNLYAVRKPLLFENHRNFLNITKQEEYVNFLNECLKNKKIIEAIFLSSYSFYKELENIKFNLNNLKNSKKDKVVESLSNYINRFLFRATPFGTSSSVGYIFKNITEEKFVRFITVDIQWLYKVKEIIENDKNNFLKFKVIWNPLAVVNGNKIKLLDSFNKGVKIVIKTIDYNDIIKFMLGICNKKEKQVSILMDKIIKKFPMLNLEKLYLYLYKLYKEEFLLINLSIDLTKKDIFLDFINKIKKINKNWYVKLLDIYYEFEKYTKLQSNYVEQLKNIRLKMLNIIKSNEYYKVDYQVIGSNIQISSKQISNLKKAIEFLIFKQENIFNVNPIIQKYVNRFIEFYGIETEVKLLDLLDSSKGLGNPYEREIIDESKKESSDTRILNLILYGYLT